MKNTITAKNGYKVKYIKGSDKKIANVYDGNIFLMKAKVLTKQEVNEEKQNNEMFTKQEVFTTEKGNQFIYYLDIEVNEDFIYKVNN